MKAPLVEVVRRRSPRPFEPPSAPLPPTVLSALGSIVKDMRDVPRDCFIDRAELITWLNRMARRVEGVATMKLPEPPRIVRRPQAPAAATVRALTARERAEAVFASPSKACAAKGLGDETLHAASAPTTGKHQAVARRPATRTVVSRKGRAVPVEIRRARAGGQMELGI